jgi:hypothetical protein
MSNWLKTVVVLNLALTLALAGLAAYFWMKPGLAGKDQSSQSAGRAATFEASGLWKAAALEYQKAAGSSEGARAFNFWVKAGDLCYDKAHDYDCAAESYLSGKAAGANNLAPDTATKLVNSLKNLGKKEQADAWLNDLTALKPKPGEADTVVARLGERGIMLSELKSSLAGEPDAIKKNFEGKEGLRKYLNYYLFRKLLYQAALDANLADEQFNTTLETFKERYLSDLYYQKNILSRVEVSDQELKDYFDKNPGEFKDASGKPEKFEAAKPEIEMKLKRNKALIENDLWLKEKVQAKGIQINEQAFTAPN